MRILVISNLFPPNVFGGAEVLIANLVDVLQNSHEVCVLTSRSACTFPSCVRADLDIDVPYPHAYRATPLDRYRVARHNALTTSNAIHQFKPDVVLASDMKRISVAPILVAQGMCPTAVFVHDIHSIGFVKHRTGPFRQFTTAIDKLMYTCGRMTLDFAIANSHNTLAVQRPELTIRQQRVVGVGIQCPSNLPALLESTQRDPKKIVYLGRIEPEKGVHTIIEALATLGKMGVRDLTLQIAGFANDSKYLDRLRDLTRLLGLDGRVQMLGKLPEDQKFSFLASAAAFVFASTWQEGHGQTYLEAMLCETPCVCTAAGGAAEVLEDRVNCLLFSPDNPQDLARALNEILTSSSLRERLVLDARRMVLERFTREQFACRLEQALQECIAIHGSANSSQ